MDSPISYVRIKSEIGYPIQLSDLHPVACESLTRVGGANDGGYVVPLVAVKAARALLSFGLSHDWTFERDFRKHNQKAIVHCYDHTVSLWTAFRYSIGQLVRFILLLRPSALHKAFTWLDYRRFFRTEGVHFKQRIWHDNESDRATIDDAFGRLPQECPVFVKMDIEGIEYHILDDLLRHSSQIVAMAIDDPYPYLRGMICELGYEIKTIQFEQPRRLRGISKNNLYTLYDIAMLGIVSHSKVPIRIAAFFGFVLGLLSVFAALAYLALKLTFWDEFPFGLAPIMIGVFFLFGFQLMFVGILGEYIGSIHTYIQRRPTVIEKERVNF